MNPLVILGGGALLLLMLKGKGGSASETPDGNFTAGPRITVKMPSGTTWAVENGVDMESHYVYTKVALPPMSSGLSEDQPMFTFVTPIGATSPNTLITFNPEAPGDIIQRALRDFNVTVPPGVELPE